MLRSPYVEIGKAAFCFCQKERILVAWVRADEGWWCELAPAWNCTGKCQAFLSDAWRRSAARKCELLASPNSGGPTQSEALADCGRFRRK